MKKLFAVVMVLVMMLAFGAAAFAAGGKLTLQYWGAKKGWNEYISAMICETDGQPVNDIAKRLMLETNTVTPLLKRMEAEGIVTRSQGKKDARQMIVSLTPKGKELQNKLSRVPFTVGEAVICDSVNPDTFPDLFRMLDDIIGKLSDNK